MAEEIIPDEAAQTPQEVPVQRAKAKGSGFAAGAAATAEDLSQEVARTVERRPGEQVTCRRVGDSNYRCNWWVMSSTKGFDNPSMLGSLVTTSRIDRSRFLHVTRDARKLLIRDDTRR
jgi:hypothetical protein